MTRPKRGIRRAMESFSWLLLDKLVSLGGAAVIGIAIARHLGPHDYGLLNYVVALAALAAAVGGLGLSGIVTRDLMYNPDDEARILGTISVMTTVAMIVVAAFISAWVFLTPSTDPRISWIIVLVMASGVFRRFEFLESWFVVHAKVRSYAIARIGVVVAFLAVKAVLLVLDASLQAFLITLAAEAAISGIRSFVAYRMACASAGKWVWDKSLAIGSLRRSWPILISGITAFIYLRLDVMMLTWWVSPNEAGIYAAAARISEVWYFAPQLLMNAIFPELLKLRKTDMTQYHKRLQDTLDLLAAGGTAVAVAITLTAWWFIPLLYGPAYASAANMLMVHVWAGIFVFMRAVLSKWLIAEDLYFFSLVTHGAGAIINVGMNIWLIPDNGGMGAAISTLLSYATAGFLSLLLHRKTHGMFIMMAKSLLWPRRLPFVWKLIQDFTKRRSAA